MNGSIPAAISTRAETRPLVQSNTEGKKSYFCRSHTRDDLEIRVCSYISCPQLAVLGSTDDKLRSPRVVVDARRTRSIELIDTDMGAEVAEVENTTAAVFRGAQWRRKIAVWGGKRRQRLVRRQDPIDLFWITHQLIWHQASDKCFFSEIVWHRFSLATTFKRRKPMASRRQRQGMLLRASLSPQRAFFFTPHLAMYIRASSFNKTPR